MDKLFLDRYIQKAAQLYQKKEIGLHEPVFFGNEKKYLNIAIDSTFVSYSGEFVDTFETNIAKLVGTKYAVSTVNGTSALHAALLVSGVTPGDEVITQALTFVATANAISYCNATPVFLDVDEETMGLCPSALKLFLESETEIKHGAVFNRKTGNKIACILPMHTFGIPAKIEEICEVASSFGLTVLEDAAEALGSKANGQSVGSFGKFGVFSFNANKIITSGGGGMIVTDDCESYIRLQHITKTSKLFHKYEFYHDEVGYNYRMPNINACIGVAQLESFEDILLAKKELAFHWEQFFNLEGFPVIKGRKEDDKNNWLIAIRMENKSQRNEFLEYTNSHGISSRPIWTLMSDLPMYHNAVCDELKTSRCLADTVINVPSGIPSHRFK